MLIWKALEQGLAADEIANEMVATYEITPDDALRNVEATLKQLQSYNLIGTSNGGS